MRKCIIESACDVNESTRGILNKNPEWIADKDDNLVVLTKFKFSELDIGEDVVDLCTAIYGEQIFQ